MTTYDEAAAARAERNACAQLADEMADRYERNAANPHERGTEMRNIAAALRALASAIRARHRMTP